MRGGADATVKLGEMLADGSHRGGKSDRSSRGRTPKPLPDSITRKVSHRARTMFRKPTKNIFRYLHFSLDNNHSNVIIILFV